MNMHDFSDILRERAHWTHEIIRKGYFHRLGIMEETLTDIHLLSIADKYSDFVYTKKFSRREEGAHSGADWLWIIGEQGSWIPLLIQAKIINPETGNCQRLDYSSGMQRRKLLAYARKHKFLPVYLIYSYIPPSFRPPSSLFSNSRKKEDWACSFVSPRTVRVLSSQGIKHQNDILSMGIPWMDPFSHLDTTRKPTGQTIAERFIEIREEFNNQRKLLLNSNLSIIQSGDKLAKSRISWENFSGEQSVVPKIPKFVQQLLNNKNYEGYPPFSEISIISTKPIKQIEELK